MSEPICRTSTSSSRDASSMCGEPPPHKGPPILHAGDDQRTDKGRDLVDQAGGPPSRPPASAHPRAAPSAHLVTAGYAPPRGVESPVRRLEPAPTVSTPHDSTSPRRTDATSVPHTTSTGPSPTVWTSLFSRVSESARSTTTRRGWRSHATSAGGQSGIVAAAACRLPRRPRRTTPATRGPGRGSRGSISSGSHRSRSPLDRPGSWRTCR